MTVRVKNVADFKNLPIGRTIILIGVEDSQVSSDEKFQFGIDGPTVGAGFKPALILHDGGCCVTRPDRNVCPTFTPAS